MCTTRHSLEPFLKLKTVLDKSASSLSDCYVSTLMVWCGCGAQRCSDTPQIGRAHRCFWVRHEEHTLVCPADT